MTTATVSDLVVDLSTLHSSFEQILNQAVERLENFKPEINEAQLDKIATNVASNEELLNKITEKLKDDVIDHLTSDKSSSLKTNIVNTISACVTEILLTNKETAIAEAPKEAIEEETISNIVSSQLMNMDQFKHATKCAETLALLFQFADEGLKKTK